MQGDVDSINLKIMILNEWLDASALYIQYIMGRQGLHPTAMYFK